MSSLAVLPIAPPRPEGMEPATWTIGSACLTGILLEVSVHPKPGLVTPRSMGAHRDMDLQTFMLTSAAIAPCFHRCAAIGLSHADDPAAVLALVRTVGRDYDRRLLAASNGVNTQRGALFALGLTAAAAGLCHDDRRPMCPDRVFAATAAITRGIVERELETRRRDPVTAGEILFDRHGVTGIRGEVEAGFPTVAAHGLPALRAALTQEVELNRALLHALIAIVAAAEDTTVLWRGGPEGLAFVRERAARICDLGGALTGRGLAEIHRFADDCVARRLSPGGGADLLAVTVAIHLLETGSFPAQVTSRFDMSASNGPAPGENP
ncbi:triphosphoribosyl-dephospho-CoA synthase MdcB [Azospirillum thermophilum]|uniref:Probable 2-(5''-triphosphoribosyl)-3'-dephosphocoenzyme-A synthase n=2 Tax=Azospirillum thermophilum TaxID=2202148 RepID=A0A2S2CVP4_9PROT|nr:triphosphoribosyl-dephospho-CoA synthase MdcB [Azospirillum thermophilum]